MTTLRVLLHVAALRDYELHSLDFSTAFLQGSLHEEIWLRCFPVPLLPFVASAAAVDLVGTEEVGTASAPIGRRRGAGSLHEGRRDTRAQTWVLQRFGFTYSSPQSTPLLTSHSLSAPPSDESVEPSGPYPELVGFLMYLMTSTRPDLAYPLSLLARYVAPVRQAWGSCLEDKLELSSLVTQTPPSSNCEAEIYTGAMAAQELRWLTYLLTDLGEAPHSPPVLTTHIALRYFLAQELQQRGQLRLAYVASQANTADVFTKALQPCDHQPCFAFLDWSCDLLFSPILPMGVSYLYPPAF
ncbi:unnamed protein product [Closterium sp. NIES-53]